ncbi:CLUMA_CG003451, isoform A [Clunio marinus]|uniref:CLUMA_CG003451, isoform A n=1 Tax=Clunio marinus TaxID=568069 RepID=A0A1J1HPB0_9DIPT|nr:CLUMA_CG003451, isoform A [Clunio marinus]
MLIKLRRLFFTLTLLIVVKMISSAPKTWPYMKTYDIWETDKSVDTFKEEQHSISGTSPIFVQNNSLDGRTNSSLRRNANGRRAKVINFFSFPIDDECLSDDGRRIGMCMNVYECRIQGGTSRGDCALGFVESTCDQEVFNNITYFVSPKFPALMPHDRTNCSIKIKLISNDISQIRLDFLHFTLSQPNRTTGICENDNFTIDGGTTPFIICGQNSAQHVLYDIGSPKARAENQELKININLKQRSVATRLWEIRISQIPFSLKAPSGCMQYFTGSEGIIQTFNFADNGRHLANQNYKACVRQEKGKCSIQYETCNDNSFRIGPNMGFGMGGSMGGNPIMSDGTLADNGPSSDPALNDDTELADETIDMMNDGDLNPSNDDGTDGSDDPTQADEPTQDDEMLADEEGSGGEAADTGFFSGFPSFTFPSFFSSFTGRRRSRQLYSPCTDRITLPCIVEDFIGVGMGDIPTCIPVHCGNSLCQHGDSSCKIETSVTPFHIGVHFGDGKTNKGSPEDNIGACLRYKQLPCS